MAPEPYVNLSTEPVDNSVDGLRESGPSADSAGQFVALASFSPFADNSIWIKKLSAVRCRWPGRGRRRSRPAQALRGRHSRAVQIFVTNARQPLGVQSVLLFEATDPQSDEP
jgi:hypothetical protein